MSTQIWLRPLCLASTVLLGACAGPQAGNYDPHARETLGRIIDKRIHQIVNRETNPSTLSAETMGAMYGAVGVMIHSLRVKRADVPIYLYTVQLQDGRAIQVPSEWSSFELQQCVTVFESSSGRTDYPRVASGNGCAPAP